MAGSCKPENAKPEVQIKIISTQNRDRIDANKLVNGKLDKDHYGSALLFILPSDYVEFQIDKKCSIWGIGMPYTDHAGTTNQPFILSKQISSEYILLGNFPSRSDGVWYKLFPNLEPGIYRIGVPGYYASLQEMYGEALDCCLYLKDNIAYGIKEEI